MTTKEALEDLKSIHYNKNGLCTNDEPAWELAFKALEKQIPMKPIWLPMDGFAAEEASALSCPTCKNPVTNYWVRGAKPAHCQFCGQAIDWEELK